MASSDRWLSCLRRSAASRTVQPIGETCGQQFIPSRSAPTVRVRCCLCGLLICVDAAAMFAQRHQELDAHCAHAAARFAMRALAVARWIALRRSSVPVLSPQRIASTSVLIAIVIVFAHDDSGVETMTRREMCASAKRLIKQLCPTAGWPSAPAGRLC
jgi:hypothetical protein